MPKVKLNRFIFMLWFYHAARLDFKRKLGPAGQARCADVYTGG
jgi:hypothetical protein